MFAFAGPSLLGEPACRRLMMHFVWMGFLKSAEPIDQEVQLQISEFLQQPYIPIDAAGVLRDGRGERAGYLVIFDAEDRAAAEALVRESPLRAAGLYSEFHLFEYQNEVG
jgi:uncharacterized protein YciI